MAVLNSWQRLTRVLPGLPFGDGADGNYSSGTIPTMTYRSCSGSASSTTLTLGSSGFSNGDIILIHQTRGTGAGQWEINRIVSGGGTTSLTLQYPLQYTYTDSGASQAQAIKILRYNNVTCSGTWNVPSWNQDTGGIFVLSVKNTLTINGTITANGCGYVGGNGGDGNTNDETNANGWTGEGTNGPSQRIANNVSANGNGGGSGDFSPTNPNSGAGGGGGGNGGSGGSGGNSGNGAIGGNGGATAGTQDLINMVFGGGGGGGGGGGSPGVAGFSGGAGGGIILIFSKTISLNNSNSLTLNGLNGNGSGNGGWDEGAGGSGAGGSCLLLTQNINLSTNGCVANGGSAIIKGSNSNHGGAGGSGRIAIHYSGTISGSTNPTYYGQFDPSLIESLGGSFLYNFI